MFIVSVEREFRAEHQLTMPDGYKELSHKHLWKVCAAVAAEKLDSAGLAFDFNCLQRLLSDITGPLAETKLDNNAPFIGINASAENVAVYIYTRLAGVIPPPVQVCWVEVTEAAGCKVRYEP